MVSKRSLTVLNKVWLMWLNSFVDRGVIQQWKMEKAEDKGFEIDMKRIR